MKKTAMDDPYFSARNLYPNADFYSGIISKAIGIPTSMFTVMFALARTSGWISHWREMTETSGHQIKRPRQLFVGNEIHKKGGC